MSHVAQIELQVKDLECLRKAAERIGMDMKDQTTYHWYGHSVGDYPLPAGFTAQDLGKCEKALVLKPDSPHRQMSYRNAGKLAGVGESNQPYEIGIVKARNGEPGYVLLADFWMGGYGMMKAVGNNFDALKKAYAQEVAHKQLRSEGWSIVEKVMENGEIKINATRETVQASW